MDQNKHPNYRLLDDFYSSFQSRNATVMSSNYTSDAVFSDPVFPELSGENIGGMWSMLCRNAQEFSLIFEVLTADDQFGSVQWQARYRFSQTGRVVENHIHSEFEFADGKIIRHTDYFDFWRWSRMALGIPGLFLGWTPFFRKKVRQQAAAALDRFSN